MMKFSLPEWLDAYVFYARHVPHELKWWVLHRIHPAHRYHKPKCSLTPGYSDWDARITNTIFEEVVDFIKHSHTDWTTRAAHREAWKVFNQAAAYWKVGRPLLLAEAEEYWETDYTELHTAAYLIEEVIVPRRDRELLIEVINNLQYMWD